jgi:hypothetical protein
VPFSSLYPICAMIGGMDESKQQTAEVVERYRKLYTGAIADILDKTGHRRQVLPYYVTPFTKNDRVAGPAFTG